MEFNGNGVTVVCLSYNMEKYIRQTLDGFVMQKVNFPLEVIVHDDASTDGSADIIREYADKYPDLIKPILQTENQYSKNILMTKTFVYPIAKGKYIATCEGDDYWTDPDKLQKQYDFLEAHPDYSFCAHAARRIDISGRTPDKILGPLKESGTVQPGEIIEKNARDMFVSANSMMFRLEYGMAKPEDMMVPRVGDKSLIIWLATIGPMYFFSEEMSVYRFHHPTSWTRKNHFGGRENKIKLFKSYLPVYPAALRHMNGENRRSIEDAVFVILRRLISLKIKLKEIKEGELREYYDMLGEDYQKKLAQYRFKAPLHRLKVSLDSLRQIIRAQKYGKLNKDR